MNTNSEKKFSLIRTISLPQTPLISFPNLIKPTSAGFWTSKNCMRVKNISVPLFSKTMGNLRPTEPKKKCRIMTETLNNIVKDVQFDELPHKRRVNSSKYFFSLPRKKCLTGVPHTELIKEIIAYNKDPNKGSGNELRANIHLNKEELDNLYKNKKKPEIRFNPARHNKKLFEMRRPVTEGAEKIYEGLEMAMLKFINKSKFKIEQKNEKESIEIKEKDSFKSIIQEIKSEKKLNYI